MSDHIEVIGSGVARATPDLLVVQLAAETHGPDVASALAASEEASAAMAAAARREGVADADLGTSNVHVSPDFDQTGRNGYQAMIGTVLTLRDLALSGRALAAVLAAGGDASRVNGIVRSFSAPGPLLDAAREAAFADARHQAQHLARLADRTLGPVLKVVPQGGFGHQRYMVMEQQAMPMAGGVPVEAGASALTVTLGVRFALT
ncbi:MAG TPA: SIMPL domain-containing protein [Actinomycetes bacterium]